MTPGRSGRGRWNGLAAAGARPGAARARPRRPRAAASALAVLLLAGVLAAVASPAAAQSAPAAPSSVTVTRADGTVTASWPEVASASSYHVTYSTTGGASWQLAALNHASASITISGADNAKTYIVGVRARNAAGDSGWRNSPPAGPHTPPAQTSPPSTPTQITVTRADGTVTASWPAVAGADSYHITYTTDGGASWHLAALNHPAQNGGGSGSGGGGASAQSSNGTATFTIYGADNGASYIVAARAQNASGASGWRNSESADPFLPPAAPSAVTVTRADGIVNASWPAVAGAYSYHVTYSTTGGASWQLAALDHLAAANTADGTASIAIASADNAATYIVAARARNSAGASGWRNSAPTGPYVAPSLGVSNVTATGATLATGLSGDWSFLANRGPHTSCTAGGSGGMATLSGLAASTHFVYRAYSDSACGAPAATLEFHTLPASGTDRLLVDAGSLDWQGASLSPGSSAADWYYRSDRAPHNAGCNGPVASGGTLALSGLSASGAYTYTRYDDSACATAVAQVSFTTAPLPDASIEISTLSPGELTLRPAGWDAQWHYRLTADGAEGGCTGPVGPGDATVAGTYEAGSSYTVKAFAASGCFSADLLDSAGFALPELTAAPGVTGAMLQLDHWPGQWWYRELGFYTPDGILASFGSYCFGPFTSWETATRTGLHSGETYGYQAFTSREACRADRKDASRLLTEGTLGRSAKVTTLTSTAVTASGVTGSTATLSVSGYSGPWHVRQTAPVQGACLPAGGGVSHRLASLAEGTPYTWEASTHPDCADGFELGSAGFTTLSLTAGAVTATSAALTLHGHTGDWWYQADAGPHSGCTSAGSAAKASLSGLNAGADYRYAAYSASGCAAQHELGTETVATLSLTASAVTATSATLKLSGRTGGWYYKANTAPHTTCQGPVGTAAAPLAALVPAVAYTYTAHSSSACDSASLLATANAFTTKVSLTVTDVTPSRATLRIDGNSAQWWYDADAGPHTTCQGPVTAGTSTQGVGGLSRGTSYTYSAYSASGCNSANLLATAAAFDTGGLSVSNLSQANNGTRGVGYHYSPNEIYAYATSFRTGSADGYTLDSIQVPFGGTNKTVWLHAYIYTDSSGAPGSPRKDLGGAKPNENATHTWHCNGSNCDLNASTTYWLVLRFNSLPAGLDNILDRWRYTSSGSQTNQPSDAGWQIGDVTYRGEQTRSVDLIGYPAISWDSSSITGAGKFAVVVKKAAALDASDISSSAATLTVSDYEGVWWHKRTLPSGDSTCRRSEAPAARVTGLSSGTSYGYTAYDKPGCADGDAIATETFSATSASAPSLSAHSDAAATAQLSLSGHSNAWHYQADAGPDTACVGPVISGVSTKDLTGLTAGTAYTYSAYGDAACSALLGSITFTTPSLAAGGITSATATLSISDYASSWHYKHTTPAGGGCSAAVSGGSTALAGLDAGVSYTFAAYSDLSCTSVIAAAASFTADAVTAADVGAASATLSLAGHSGSWHAKRTAPTPGSCSAAVAAGGTHTAAGLSPATAYTFTAYSDSSCTAAVGVGSFVTTPVTLSVSGIAARAATLRIDGYTAAWSYRRSGGDCASVNAGAATARVTGLTPDSAYSYSAYSGSSCGALLASAPAFTTLAVSVHSVADTSAVLHVANRGAEPWYYRAGTGPHSTCTGPAVGDTQPLAGLSAGGTYTYSAYGDAACTSANLLGTAAAFTTKGLTAGSITASGATLSLTGHTGAWWFRNDVPYDPKGLTPYTQCYSASGATVALSGLAAGQTYTFKAYPEYGCPPAQAIGAATFTTSSS